MTDTHQDLGRDERTAIEIQALANHTAERIATTIAMLSEYKRGFPTGGDASGDGSSRTEALALAGADIIDREQRELQRSLRAALLAMRVAYNITARYQPARKPDNPEDDPEDDIWCSHCVKFGVMSVRYRGDLCRDDYDCKLLEGVPRPRLLVEAKERGDRITQPLWARAFGRQSRAQNAQR